MKRKVLSGLLAALALAVGITSCNDDNQYEYTTSNECLITSMTMGSLKRTMHTKNSKGEDSLIYVSVTGALYPMTIDQERQRIYNLDSLPVGTDVTKVVFSSMNTIGTFSIRSLASGNDTIFTLSDSTDFSVPRMVTVHATDGTSKREYLVNINVHNEEGDSMVWHNVAHETSALSGMQNTRSHAVGDQLFVFGQRDNKTVLACANTSDYNNGGTPLWFNANLKVNIQPQSIVRFQNQFYGVDDKERLYLSSNGTEWTAIHTDFNAQMFILGGSKHLVALKDGQFYSSTDGISWTLDVADETQYLPKEFATGTSVPSNIDKTFETLVVVGKLNGKNVVWKREIDLTGNETFPWIYLPETLASQYNIPQIDKISVNRYDGVTLLSGLTKEGQVAPLYLSRDNGRTWKTDEIKTPKVQEQGALTVTVDEENFIWMFCGKKAEVWQGRINRLGWDKIPEAFEKSRHL